MLDPAIKELASVGSNFGTVCVQLPSGAIASHVMWVDADDDHMIFNTEIHRAKFRAIQPGSPVTMTVWKSDNPYSYAEVRGHVVETIGGPEARAHIDHLSRRYLGRDYTTQIQSERVIVKVAPDRQRTNNL